MIIPKNTFIYFKEYTNYKVKNIFYLVKVR